MDPAFERQRELLATDTDNSSSFWTPKAQRPPSPDQKGVYMTEETQPMNVAASGGGGYPHPGAPKPGGASFNDSPQIANVKPHKAYKIHVATKSEQIHRTPGIIRRVVTEVARLYYATGERPGFSLQGIRGKGGWDEYTVAIGPLKDSPLALAMYRVDVFMKAFTFGARYFPKSGSSLEETRRLARQAKNLEAQRQEKGIDLYDWAKEWSDNCYDFQDDDVLRDLYQQYNKAEYTSGSYCFSPYVQSCSVSEDGATFFFEPDIHVEHHGYNMQDGTPVDFSFYENQKEYVQLVKDAINSNSELAYDLDIIHIACCAYALVQSLPRDRVYNLDNIAPVPEDKEKMELLSPLQYGIVHYCVNCERDHLSGGCQPRWAKIHPEEVVGTPPSMERSFAFDLPTMAAADLGRCLRADWSRTLVENFDETLVLGVALHDRPHLLAKDYSRSQASAALDRNPHKSRLVGTYGQPFASYLKLVEYYKRGTEKSRADYKEKPGAFISGWRQSVFDAKEALLELAKKKGDSVTEAIVRTRLDVDGVYDEHTRSVAEQRLLRAATDAAAAPPVDLSKLALVGTLKGHSSKVHCCAMILPGRRVVSGSLRELKVWDVQTGECVVTLGGHSGWVDCVAVFPDGRRVVSASSTRFVKELKVWDVATGKCVATLEGHSCVIYGVAVFPDGRRVVSASRDKTLKVWDVATWKCLATLKGHSWEVWSVAVFPDGRRVVSCDGNIDNNMPGVLKVWDVATGRCVATLEGHSDCVNCVAVFPDGRRVVSGSKDETLKVWEIKGHELRQMFEVNAPQGARPGQAFALIANGQRVMVTCPENVRPGDKIRFPLTVKGETWKCVATLEGHSWHIYGVAVFPDGRRVVSASRDNTLKVWDVATRKCLATLEGHSNRVWGVAAWPNAVISTSDDGTLKLFACEI